MWFEYIKDLHKRGLVYLSILIPTLATIWSVRAFKVRERERERERERGVTFCGGFGRSEPCEVRTLVLVLKSHDFFYYIFPRWLLLCVVVTLWWFWGVQSLIMWETLIYHGFHCLFSLMWWLLLYVC